MNVLAEARHDLHETLTAAVPDGTAAWDHVPEELTGRDVAIQPGRPHIAPATLAEQYDVRLTVVLLLGLEDNQTVHTLVDEHLSALVPAALAGGWQVDTGSMSDLRTLATSNWTSYGVTFDVTATYAPTPD